MADMTILQAVKTRLRITTDIFDEDLTELIEACKIDLQTSGIEIVDDTDQLTRQAIKFYCQANFANGDVAERELYAKRYAEVKSTMWFAGKYREADTSV